MQKFKILSQETLISSPFCPIEKQSVKLPNGKITEWFVNCSQDAVIIVPQLKDGSFLLEKTYKHGCGKIIYEFPAGMIDTGETPIDAAKRELQEETGYIAKNWHFLGESFNNPTGSTMKHLYFFAEMAFPTGNQKLEEAEQIEIILIKKGKNAPLENVRKFLCKKNKPSSNSCLAAITLLESFWKTHPIPKN